MCSVSLCLEMRIKTKETGYELVHKRRKYHKSVMPFEVSWVTFKFCNKCLFKYLSLQFLYYLPFFFCNFLFFLILEDMIIMYSWLFCSFSTSLHSILHSKMFRKGRVRGHNKCTGRLHQVLLISLVCFSLEPLKSFVS